MKFHTTIQLGGKTATGFEVPVEVVTSLGSRKRPPVRVTINGHTYRSTVAVYGGVFMLPLRAENRESAGVAAGDEVEVEITLDTEPREVAVPAGLAAALDGDSAAQRGFASLSYSQQRRIVLGIEGAKSAETRQRRIAQAVNRLCADQDEAAGVRGSRES